MGQWLIFQIGDSYRISELCELVGSYHFMMSTQSEARPAQVDIFRNIFSVHMVLCSVISMAQILLMTQSKWFSKAHIITFAAYMFSLKTQSHEHDHNHCHYYNMLLIIPQVTYLTGTPLCLKGSCLEQFTLSVRATPSTTPSPSRSSTVATTMFTTYLIRPTVMRASVVSNEISKSV